jgi:hypothetical protein
MEEEDPRTEGGRIVRVPVLHLACWVSLMLRAKWQCLTCSIGSKAQLPIAHLAPTGNESPSLLLALDLRRAEWKTVSSCISPSFHFLCPSLRPTPTPYFRGSEAKSKLAEGFALWPATEVTAPAAGPCTVARQRKWRLLPYSGPRKLQLLCGVQAPATVLLPPAASLFLVIRLREYPHSVANRPSRLPKVQRSKKILQ